MEAKLKVSCYVVSGGWIKRKSSQNNKVEKNQRIKEAQRAKMKSEGQISTNTLTQKRAYHKEFFNEDGKETKKSVLRGYSSVSRIQTEHEI